MRVRGARPGRAFLPPCRGRALTAAAPRGSRAVRGAVPCPSAPLPTSTAAARRCRRRSLGFDAALTLGIYEGTVRDLCLRLKHERNAWLAPWLRLAGGGPAADLAQLPRDTLVVPVPLHWWRRLRRGYNQADALACGLGRQLHLRVHKPLRRIKSTDRLARKGVTERKEALRGLFRPGRMPA